MVAHNRYPKDPSRQKGAVIVLVALLLVFFIGIVALALDVYHLYVVRNELQNAADAGALAGTKVLYYDNSDDEPGNDPASDTLNGHVNPGANQIAKDTATQNKSEKIAVEVLSPLTNLNDVQRGHWYFTGAKAGTFEQSDNTLPTDITGKTFEELDQDPDFVNAVQVTTRREGTAAASFFARIFGYEDFGVTAQAVAYIGFVGSLAEGEADIPIAICESSITNEDDEYDCGKVRLINSADKDNSNTGALTNFSVGCTDSFDANDLKTDPLDVTSCQMKNPGTLLLNSGISTGGGQVQVIFSALQDCGGFNPKNPPVRDTPWEVTLPVVDCQGQSNPSGCLPVKGAVTMEIVLITDTFPSDEKKKYDDLPDRMGTWEKPSLTDPTKTGLDNWLSFVDHFDLQIAPDLPAEDADDYGFYQKTIYAKPSCEKSEVKGTTGGPAYGVLATIPVLVK